MTHALAASPTVGDDMLLYATAATVIPVLFLAITLQGTLYTRVLQKPDDAMRWVLAHIPISPQSLLADLIALFVYVPAFIVAWFIVLYGVIGEIIAIVGLAGQSTSMTTRYLTAAAVVVLALVAGAPSVLSLAAFVFRLFVKRPWHQYPGAARTRHDEQPDAQTPSLPPAAQWFDSTYGSALVKFLDRKLMQAPDRRRAQPDAGASPARANPAKRKPARGDDSGTDER